MTSVLLGSLERKCLSQIVSAEHQQNRQHLYKSLMLLLSLIILLVNSLSHQSSFRSFWTTQPTMLTYSYCKTQSCKDGWQKETKYLKAIRPYFAFCDEIVYCDGLFFGGNQLVVPKAMQAEMLSHMHESHQGIVKSKQPARSYFSGQA